MKAGKIPIENRDTILRRSSRKRKLKRESDLDFDYNYHEIEQQSTQPVSKKAPYLKTPENMPKGSKPKIREVSVYKYPTKIKTSVVSDRGSNKSEITRILQYNEKSEKCSVPSCDEKQIPEMLTPEVPKTTMNNLVKLRKIQLIEMNSEEIIKVHCQNLKIRLENIADSYVEAWKPSPSTPVPWRQFLDSSALNFLTFETDYFAVRKVVSDMLNVVSSFYE